MNRDTDRALEALKIEEQIRSEIDNLYNFVSAYDDYIIRNSLSLLPILFQRKTAWKQL